LKLKTTCEDDILTALILAKCNNEMNDRRFAYSNCKNTENVFITFCGGKLLSVLYNELTSTAQPSLAHQSHCRVKVKLFYTGRFIMFSVITNIYNKKTKGST